LLLYCWTVVVVVTTHTLSVVTMLLADGPQLWVQVTKLVLLPLCKTRLR
jgi:hypothetical protein